MKSNDELLLEVIRIAEKKKTEQKRNVRVLLVGMTALVVLSAFTTTAIMLNNRKTVGNDMVSSNNTVPVVQYSRHGYSFSFGYAVSVEIKHYGVLVNFSNQSGKEVLVRKTVDAYQGDQLIGVIPKEGDENADNSYCEVDSDKTLVFRISFYEMSIESVSDDLIIAFHIMDSSGKETIISVRAFEFLVTSK